MRTDFKKVFEPSLMLLFPPHVGFEDWSDGEMPVDGGDTIPLNLLHSPEKVTIFCILRCTTGMSFDLRF